MARSFTNTVLNLPRVSKRAVALALDALLCLATVAFAYYLRLGEWAWPQGTQWLSYAAALLFAIPLFITFGLYRAIFRFAGWDALLAVARACTIYGLIYSSVFTLVGVQSVPRTIGIIQPILLLLAIGASRGVARAWLGGALAGVGRGARRQKVLIYGAGSAGRQLAGALATSRDVELVGFIDDDPTLSGSVLNGKTIHGPSRLPDLIGRHEITDLLLAMPAATRKRRNEILDQVRPLAVAVRTLPGLMDLAQGRVTVNDLRELEIEDLLGRDAVPPNQILLGRNIAGKTVMVTGAGGSIGSELCRQIVQLNPARLLLVEMGEFALYSIHQELEGRLAGHEGLSAEVVPLLASVCDEERLASIVQAWKPDTVYHAAAYKHVPLVEHNPAEGVRNNVFGTFVAARVARAAQVRDFVLVSTDKAVRPTNVMGASKRLAEMILQALAAEGGPTRFSMVRFGNVLGSSGSVVPLFRNQIRNGGPVTITHQEITRYFMTIPEAAQLVIQAGAMAAGGDVFVLDMGEPVKIMDLARRMIELSGLSLRDDDNPQGDVEIEIVGLRPGEKLYEELLIGNNPSPTAHSRIMKALEPFLPWTELSHALDALDREIAANDAVAVRAHLNQLVSDFTPESEVVDLVHLERQRR